MLKATGIVRKVDELGRIVLPVELRRTLEVRQNDPVEIYVDGENIIIQKYRRQCVFCGEHEGLEEFQGKPVCRLCAAALGATNQVVEPESAFRVAHLMLEWVKRDLDLVEVSIEWTRPGLWNAAGKALPPNTILLDLDLRDPQATLYPLPT